jgi:hypothetical protein
MKRFACLSVVSLLLALTGCSVGGSAHGSLTLDSAATSSCQQLQQLIADRPTLSPDQLRARLGTVYNEAQRSSNAIIQARAVALYADATVIASGGESSLEADLTSMQKACSGGGGRPRAR